MIKNVIVLGRVGGADGETRTPGLLITKYEAKAERTIKRLVQGQEFDIRNLYHENGRLNMSHELDEDTAKAVVGVRYDSNGALIKYEIIDVKGCCELVGKHLKLFIDKVEHDINDQLMMWLTK